MYQKFQNHVLLLLGVVLFQVCATLVGAQYPIPAKYDGFVYKVGHHRGLVDAVLVEAFYDPMCPYSRASWPALKQAVDHYGHRVSLIVHTFPLPYHDNAFISSRGLHIARKLNSSSPYPLLELFFKHQEEFYNKPTRELSRASVISKIAKLMTQAVGSSSENAIIAGFNDTNTDLATRISFKYSCSRGVYGTPTFFVNGFPLPDDGSDVDYKKWRSVIDPLLGEKFYNRPTYHLSRATVITDIVELMASATGDASLANIESGFQWLQGFPSRTFC